MHAKFMLVRYVTLKDKTITYIISPFACTFYYIVAEILVQSINYCEILPLFHNISLFIKLF